MTTIEEAARVLLSAQDILLITHKRPDGDTLGSAAALCRGLRMRKKNAFLLGNPEVTAKYLGFVKDLYAPEGFVPAFVASVDVASGDLMQINAQAYAGKVDLVLDHHPTNAGFGSHNCVYPQFAATGELIYQLLRQMDVLLDKDSAESLYVAVSTDTGCFKYSNTTANSHRVAAAAMDMGIDAAALNRELFDTKTRARIELERRILGDMQFFFGDRVAVCYVTRAAIEAAGAGEDDVDNVSALPRQVEGVDAGVTIREENGGCKISLRTSERMDASGICAKLGGGGHLRAAGCNLKGTVKQAADAILSAILEEYPDVKRDTCTG